MNGSKKGDKKDIFKMLTPEFYKEFSTNRMSGSHPGVKLSPADKQTLVSFFELLIEADQQERRRRSKRSKKMTGVGDE